MSGGRVLLTGATGFIGSHLVTALLAAGYEVTALRRASSNLNRLAGAAKQCTWISTDDPDWEAQVMATGFEYLLHAAWLGGVSAGQRDNWPGQLSNLDFTLRLLQLVKQGAIRKVVALGSQAEYGQFTGRIAEEAPLNPTTAYGAAKVATLAVLRAFCQAHNIEWYWLRIFATFGPHEDPQWFISFVASALLTGQPANLTGCQQRYDYLFVKSLTQAIVRVLSATGADRSGVYNVSANQATSLRHIVDTLRDITNSTASVSYGAVPYRPGQVMHMEGNSDKFEDVFGRIDQPPLREALAETVDWLAARP